MKTLTSPTALANLMMVRNTNDTEHHMTLDGWKGESLCGTRPQMREIGWMFGKTGSSEGLVICEECRAGLRESVNAYSR
jgi:hypothetical protein